MSARPLLSTCRDPTGVKDEACSGAIVLLQRDEVDVSMRSFSWSSGAGAKSRGYIDMARQVELIILL